MTNVTASFRKWVDQNISNAISLEHDYYKDTAAVVKESMDILISSGKRIVPLREYLGILYVDGNTILEDFFESGQFENTYATTTNTAVSQTIRPGDSAGVIPSTDTPQVSQESISSGISQTAISAITGLMAFLFLTAGILLYFACVKWETGIPLH
ncbi:hypothetical protein BDR26DRAFT_15653 [Obelidium mucronatum]|nr:hypothetical protein BDR26DRAFT_15653 [Obelidium mucronatum]